MPKKDKSPPGCTSPQTFFFHFAAGIVLTFSPAQCWWNLKKTVGLGNLQLPTRRQLAIIGSNAMVMLALPHVLPHLRHERHEGRAASHVRSPFLNCCCFPLIQTHSDMCGFHWTVCVLGNGLEVRLPLLLWPGNAKRLRFVICSIWQTQWRVWRGRGLT